MSQRWTSGSMTATVAIGACCVGCGCIYHTSVRLRVARSIQMGTCQSLKKQDEQQIRFLRFFCFTIYAKHENLWHLSYSMNTIFKLLSLLLMTATAMALASCGDDDGGSGDGSGGDFEENGNVVASSEICNFGGQRLTNVDDYYKITYNTDDSIREIQGGDYNITFNYVNGVMTISCSEFTHDYDFTTNSKGYITEMRGNLYDDAFAVSAVNSFKYNKDDHLTYVSCETTSFEGVELMEKLAATWTLTWSNELLTSVYFSKEHWDSYGSEGWQEEYTYSYADAPENIYMQYTRNIVNDIYFHDYLEALVLVGLFGKAPAYYPTKIITSEVGTTFTHEHRYEYILNSNGLVETETRTTHDIPYSHRYVYSSSL